METTPDAKQKAWNGDALDRKPLADFLTKSIVSQTERLKPEDKGLTLCLDAKWGAGKTFFVKNWLKDLRADNRPAIYFDAWENDIGDQASVALMAAILSGLDEWKKKIPVANAAYKRISDAKKQTIQKLRRSIIPATTIIAKALLKKTTGIAVEELMEHLDVESDSVTPVKQDNKKTIDQALDKIFENILAEHDARKESIGSFRV